MFLGKDDIRSSAHSSWAGVKHWHLAGQMVCDSVLPL